MRIGIAIHDDFRGEGGLANPWSARSPRWRNHGAARRPAALADGGSAGAVRANFDIVVAGWRFFRPGRIAADRE